MTIRPVLTLDLARSMGWCAGVPGHRPRFGVVHHRGQCHGEAYASLANWLEDAARVHAPGEVCFEAPLARGQHSGIAAGRLLLGMVAVVQMFCWDHSIRCTEAPVASTRKAVLGRGTFPKGTAKAEVARWCRDNGFDPPDDNAADALVLWKHVEQLRPKAVEA